HRRALLRRLLDVILAHVLDSFVERGDHGRGSEGLRDGDDAHGRRISPGAARGRGDLGARGRDARACSVGLDEHGAHGPGARRVSQVAGVSGPWYPGAAVMRDRSACWTPPLVVAAGFPAQAQSPSPPDLVAPVRLVEAARQPELADLASYLEVRAAATKDDPERATVAARSLIERHPDSIWIGFARLDVGRVRRRTGDLAGARTW